MKTKRALLAALMMIAATVFAQAQSFYPVLKTYSDAKKEQLDVVFATSLGTDYYGLTESALAIVTMMKLDGPADEYPNIREKIEDLVTDGATPVVRYKAYLADAVYANPEMFRNVSERQYETPDAFFSAVAERMSETLLSVK